MTPEDLREGMAQLERAYPRMAQLTAAQLATWHEILGTTTAEAFSHGIRHWCMHETWPPQSPAALMGSVRAAQAALRREAEPEPMPARALDQRAAIGFAYIREILASRVELPPDAPIEWHDAELRRRWGERQ